MGPDRTSALGVLCQWCRGMGGHTPGAGSGGTAEKKSLGRTDAARGTGVPFPTWGDLAKLPGGGDILLRPEDDLGLTRSGGWGRLFQAEGTVDGRLSGQTVWCGEEVCPARARRAGAVQSAEELDLTELV